MGDQTGIYSKADHKDFLSTVGLEPAVAGIVAAGGSAALAANAACLVRVKAQRAITVNQLLWVCGTQSGNYDIGIYDEAGTRLWSKGSTASPASGMVTETVSPGVTLRKGQAFHVALVADNATATFRATTLVSAELTKTLTGKPAAVTVTSSFPLPSSLTVGTATVLRIPLVVIRES